MSTTFGGGELETPSITAGFYIESHTNVRLTLECEKDLRKWEITFEC